MAPSPEELAEDTVAHLPRRPGFDAVDRGDLVLETSVHRALVSRIRLGDVDEAVAWTRERARAAESPRLEWWAGWHATPADLPERLLALGFEADDEEPVLTGMTCAVEPPAAPGVEVRAIGSLEEQLEALEVDWAVWDVSPEERALRSATEKRRFASVEVLGFVHHFAAWADGRPVGFGRAIDVDGGVALMGGAVLPAYRNRGIYRALVRARWDHAAARGTPLLVVQAGHMSAPVLEGLGFVRHGDLRLFVDRA